MNDSSPPRILAIAGSDSSGGAGIQADIKTITMLSGYAMSAITCVTAQNTLGVQQIDVLSPALVASQIASCLDDIGADAVKIGMLGSPEIANAVREGLSGFTGPVVFDPVMAATSGSTLADSATIDAFADLMQSASLITPNLPELAALTGMPVETGEEIYRAGAALAVRHDTSVLAKGGHGDDARIVDRLIHAGGAVTSFDHARIDTRHTHGTGCTLSCAIATLLGHGQPMEHAVRLGREFVLDAIRQAPGFGAGSGPLGHAAAGKG